MAGGNVSSQLGPLFAQAGAANKIPPEVLAGIASVETNLGGNIATSSTGAQGLMQFEPGTAKGLGVNPANAASAINGAAKLLNQYGYQSNPLRAIGAYNGGPGNPQYGYANQVMSEASRLKGQLQPYLGAKGGKLTVLPGSGATATPASTVSTTKMVLDQPAYQQAVKASIAGRYLAGSGKNDPYSAASPKTGLEGASSLSGVLPTAAPNPADYQTAQTTLQKIAAQGSTDPSKPVQVDQHPQAVVGKLLALAKGAVGGPYSQANHATALLDNPAELKSRGTDCSGFVSWLMGPNGLGIWKGALATPDIASAPGIQAGAGKDITIYNNPLPGNSGHVFIEIAGQYFQSAGGGTGIQPIAPSVAAQMIAQGDNGARYYPLHPKGL